MSERRNVTNPFIGCGATYAIGTDLHPCTVVEFDGERVGVSFDKVYGNGVFNPAPLGRTPDRWFERGDDGVYRLEGRSFGALELGHRANYRDPHFGPERIGRRR